MAESADAIDTFSYAAPDDPRLKRFFIRLIERLTGQPYLKWVYEDNRAHPVPGEDFWSAAIRRLELKLDYNSEALATWPKEGPLVVVANHPFGVLDGLIICQIVSQVRSDFRVLTNAVLLRAEEVIREAIVHGHVIELRGRLVELRRPVLAAIDGDGGAAVVAIDHALRVGWIDPEISWI